MAGISSPIKKFWEVSTEFKVTEDLLHSQSNQMAPFKYILRKGKGSYKMAIFDDFQY